MKTKDYFNSYIDLFLTQNATLNLISKNDEKYLWEKHIFDSLSIEKFFEKFGNNFNTMLDFGTGGGFPSVPIAIAYPELKVTAVDSIRKKINSICTLKNELNLTNLTPICARVETLTEKYDLVTSRAVASLDKLIEYAIPRLNDNGYFIAFKSRRASEEIKNSEKILKKHNAQIVDIIEYNLPLDENHIRNFVIIRKKQAK